MGSLLTKNFFRALILGALLFSTDVWAKTRASRSSSEKIKKENHQDLIEKAQALSLQGARLQAVTILTSALNKEVKRPQVVKELTSSLEQIAKLFVSEKAQQLYELGLSLRPSDQNTAISKLNEAAKIEPDNLSIDLTAARIHLMLLECDKAFGRLERWKDAENYLEELKLAQAQVSLCRGDFKDFIAIKPVDAKKALNPLAWMILEAEHAYRSGQFQKTLELSGLVNKHDGQFPEAHYWLFKAQLELKLNPENSGQKYLSLCKSLSGRSQRQYMIEPMLCRRVIEIEAALKKMSNVGT